MNKVKLVGILEKLEKKVTANAVKYTVGVVKVDDSYINNKTNEAVDRDVFVNVVAFSKTAEVFGLLKVGDEVQVDGKITSNEYNGKYFNNVFANVIKKVAKQEVPVIEYPENDVDVKDVPF